MTSLDPMCHVISLRQARFRSGESARRIPAFKAGAVLREDPLSTFGCSHLLFGDVSISSFRDVAVPDRSSGWGTSRIYSRSIGGLCRGFDRTSSVFLHNKRLNFTHTYVHAHTTKPNQNLNNYVRLYHPRSQLRREVHRRRCW